jgi:hypothetical protein
MTFVLYNYPGAFAASVGTAAICIICHYLATCRTACGKIGDLSFAWVYQVAHTNSLSLFAQKSRSDVRLLPIFIYTEQITHFEDEFLFL